MSSTRFICWHAPQLFGQCLGGRGRQGWSQWQGWISGSTAFSLDQNTWLSLGQALDHLVQFWFSITDVRVGICTDPILRDGIKYTVVTRAEEIKKVHEVPCLGANGYKSALKYVYEYIRCENLQEIKTEETFYENLD
ncbi:uncharacterized protein LOC120676022 isoform X2 [Panicum virgatum]|uniref:uncharacterized protein LOC120676022 isoform X2 n=1 Tax=Panicum virgatum TaxID=38727 RepID=UPI0019D4F687|nr:uncharacterized protein LOC120676022 isoform X2 [Panicum virgatum]